jgi:hypothetical protein
LVQFHIDPLLVQVVSATRIQQPLGQGKKTGLLPSGYLAMENHHFL